MSLGDAMCLSNSFESYESVVLAFDPRCRFTGFTSFTFLFEKRVDGATFLVDLISEKFDLLGEVVNSVLYC